MKEIIRGEEWVLPYYDNNENNNMEYKLSDYVFVEKCDDGYLLLHTITWSLFLLNEFEYENILKYDYFKKWFIVLDKNINEEEIAIKIYLERATSKTPPSFTNVSIFDIYMTNNCNARCSYCYRLNDSYRENMTEETAINIGDFIAKNTENAYIEWLGGEPLVNAKSIDKICETLINKNISYHSKLVTNGLLLNDENIEKCKYLWNVKNIQVTFDGLYETYNSIKNYTNKTVNAFETVISNIKNCLLKTDIYIDIRINISIDNLHQLERIVKYFYDNFNEWLTSRINIYYSHLFQIQNDFEKLKIIKNEAIRIKSIYPCLTFYMPENLKHDKLYKCMAETGKALGISPKGDLTLCGLSYEEHIIGHINCGITNKSLIEEWSIKDGDNIENCVKYKCNFLPICFHNKKCPNTTYCHNIEKKLSREEEFKERINITYNEYKKRINQIKNGEE